MGLRAKLHKVPLAASSLSFCADPAKPVERALQNVGGSVLVDDGGALPSAGVGGDQFALDRGGREPLVPERDRQLGDAREIAREGARGLGARALAAIHVER